MIPDTGGQSVLGSLSRAGVEICMDMYDNGLVAVRQIELFFEDTASDAAIAVQKAQKLIEEYGCEILIGPQSGSEATAVKEYAGSQPGITFVMGGGGDTMTYGVVIEKLGFNASLMSIDSYNMLQVVFEALELTNGDTSNLQAFRFTQFIEL